MVLEGDIGEYAFQKEKVKTSKFETTSQVGKYITQEITKLHSISYPTTLSVEKKFDITNIKHN